MKKILILPAIASLILIGSAQADETVTPASAPKVGSTKTKAANSKTAKAKKPVKKSKKAPSDAYTQSPDSAADDVRTMEDELLAE